MTDIKFATYYGMKIYQSPAIPTIKTIRVKIDKPWWERFADTVLRWNPCNDWQNPDFQDKQVPNDEVYISSDSIYASPAIIADITA